MSLDLGHKGRGVFYLNFITIGTGKNTAKATQEFNFGNLVEKSGSYIVAIERLVLPIHRLPMINALTPALIFVPTGLNLQFTINTSEAYSWKEFLDDINNQLEEILNLNTSLFLNQSGRVKIVSGSWNDYNIQFHPLLQQIFDFENIVVGLGDSNADNEVIGRSSIIDRFDQLHKVQIEARGMNLQQEIIDTDRSLPILTDFIAPNSFSLAYDEDLEANTTSSKDVSVSYTTRQNIIYTASEERRMVMLRGNTPIQNLTIQCVAIFKDNSRNEITLPPRSVFEVKLAFFKR